MCGTCNSGEQFMPGPTRTVMTRAEMHAKAFDKWVVPDAYMCGHIIDVALMEGWTCDRENGMRPTDSANFDVMRG